MKRKIEQQLFKMETDAKQKTTINQRCSSSWKNI